MPRLSAVLPPLVLVLGLSLAGCFPRPDYRDLPDVSAIPRTVSVLDTVAVADLAAPTDAERAAVATALTRAGETGFRVKVRLPQGVPAPTEAEFRRHVALLGVDPAIAVAEPGASPQGSALVFLRVTVSAPDCATMVTPSEILFSRMPLDRHRPTMAFGCATLGNLSRMVTDPADLAAGRAYGGADAAVVGAGIDRYHQDKVTPLRKTTSTSGTGSGGSQ